VRHLPLLLLLGLVVLPLPREWASASCAGPSLDLPADTVLARGAAVTVEGRAFVDGCRDTMSCTGAPGCSSCEYDEPPQRPLQDVALVLVQDGRTWPLAVADAGDAGDDRLGRVAWTFDLPPGVRRGPARLDAGDQSSVDVRIS
jgi:hypothetical protein